jgi:hypothetical protein
VELVGRPASPGRGRPHSVEMDWAYWPNRDSAEFAAAIRHCVSSVHGTRANSCGLNPENTVPAIRASGNCLRKETMLSGLAEMFGSG